MAMHIAVVLTKGCYNVCGMKFYNDTPDKEDCPTTLVEILVCFGNNSKSHSYMTVD